MAGDTASVLIMVIGGALLLIWLSVALRARASRRWPTVLGQVTSSFSLDSSSSVVTFFGKGGYQKLYSPLIEYQYRVGDETYYSTRIDFGRVLGREGGEAEELLNRFRDGSRPVIHYNPKQPSFSVLLPKMAGSAHLLLVVGALLFIIGVLATFFPSSPP